MIPAFLGLAVLIGLSGHLVCSDPNFKSRIDEALKAEQAFIQRVEVLLGDQAVDLGRRRDVQRRFHAFEDLIRKHIGFLESLGRLAETSLNETA